MSAHAEASSCRRCGTPLGSAREYCVGCGARLARPRAVGTWRGAPPFAWPVLGLLLLAATGALVAVAATRETTSETVVATTYRLAKAPPPRPVATATSTAVSTLPNVAPTVPIPPPSPRPKTTSTLTEWTASDGQTVVLASVPSAGGREHARRIARDALRKGLTEVGVLDSKDFTSLHPGYLVVFTGVFGVDESAAVRVGEAVAAGFDSAYVRRITQ